MYVLLHLVPRPLWILKMPWQPRWTLNPFASNHVPSCKLWNRHEKSLQDRLKGSDWLHCRAQVDTGAYYVFKCFKKRGPDFVPTYHTRIFITFNYTTALISHEKKKIFHYLVDRNSTCPEMIAMPISSCSPADHKSDLRHRFERSLTGPMRLPKSPLLCSKMSFVLCFRNSTWIVT